MSKNRQNPIAFATKSINPFAAAMVKRIQMIAMHGVKILRNLLRGRARNKFFASFLLILSLLSLYLFSLLSTPLSLLFCHSEGISASRING